MPPRYSYWTIIAGGLPTAFRAAEREELLPTFSRLRQKQPDAEMKWFARGRLWESPADARAELEHRRAREDERGNGRTRGTDRGGAGAGDRRGRDWRPGGDHRDPRQKFKDAKRSRNQRWRDERFARKQTGDRRQRESRVSSGPKPDWTTRNRAPGRDQRPEWQHGPRAPRHDRKPEWKPGDGRKHASGSGGRRPRLDRKPEWTSRDRPARGGEKPEWLSRGRGPHPGGNPPRDTRGVEKPRSRWDGGQDAGAQAKRPWRPAGGRGPVAPKRSRRNEAGENESLAPKPAWKATREGRRPFEHRGFPRNQGTEEPKAPPRPRGPNREPRPSESPEPTPPPRPSEPTIPPPTPERGRAPAVGSQQWKPGGNRGPSHRPNGPRGGGPVSPKRKPNGPRGGGPVPPKREPKGPRGGGRRS